MADTSGTIIEARGLSKWFGEVVAINNLNFDINAGVTGLLGPNGAGKSTFIKTALGLYNPSRGTIAVLGESPRNNLAILRRIGYCPEHDRLNEDMTGFEFVYWMARTWGVYAAPAEKLAEEACERVGMPDRMDDPIATYSKGMRQRVKIAQALVMQPDLLFLDEPMAGLDPKGREEMFDLIRALGDEGRTLIVSSHILYEIERVTDSVVMLHGGMLLAQGHVREIRELIDEHPHAVDIECNDPHGVANHFLKDPSTLNIEFSDHGVTIRTRDPNGFYEKLNTLVRDKAVTIETLQCPDDNLQSVFDYLVKR